MGASNTKDMKELSQRLSRLVECNLLSHAEKKEFWRSKGAKNYIISVMGTQNDQELARNVRRCIGIHRARKRCHIGYGSPMMTSIIPMTSA